MGVTETNVLKQCQLAAAEFGCVLLRNNRGVFLTLDGKRKARAGLEPNGSSDLIGWCQGTFVAVEVKQGSGRATEEQIRFLKAVNKSGGIGILAYSPEDVKNCLKSRIGNVL